LVLSNLFEQVDYCLINIHKDVENQILNNNNSINLIENLPANLNENSWSNYDF